MPSFSFSTSAARGVALRPPLAAAVLALAAAASVGAHESGRRAVFVGVTLLAALGVSLLLRWQTLLLVTLGLVFVEALARRFWVNEVALFFVKDVVLAVAYAKFSLERLAARRPLVPRSAIGLVLAAFAALCVLELANPRLPALAVGVNGLHAWVWYLPVVALAAAAFPTARDAVAALRLLGFVSVPLAVLAALQIWALTLNQSYYQKIHGPTVYWVGNRLIADRSVSTFASTGAYADFVIFSVIVAFALVLRARGRSRTAEAVVVFAGIVLAIGGSGSRGAVMAILVGLALFLALHRRRDARTGLAIGLTGALFLLALTVTGPLPGLYRAVGGLSRASIVQRVHEHVTQPLEQVGTTTEVVTTPAVTTPATTTPATTTAATTTAEGGAVSPTAPETVTVDRSTTFLTALIGNGVGLGAGGSEHLDAFLNARQLAETVALAAPEAGWLGLVWEFGIGGLLLFVALFALIALTAWRSYRESDDEDVRTLAFAGILLIGVTAALMCLSTKLGSVNFTLFFWFFVGLAVAAGRFAADARR